jgi:hypothetical protein
MSNKRPNIVVATADLGRLETLSEKHTIVASFHGFPLPHKKGDFTLSPEMYCHWLPWKIVLYPGGKKIKTRHIFQCI